MSDHKPLFPTPTSIILTSDRKEAWITDCHRTASRVATMAIESLPKSRPTHLVAIAVVAHTDDFHLVYAVRVGQRSYVAMAPR